VDIPTLEKVDNLAETRYFALGILAYLAEVKAIEKAIFCNLCITNDCGFCCLCLTNW
jgi:hypothetical protein